MGTRTEFILVVLIVAAVGGLLGLLVAKRRVPGGEDATAERTSDARRWPLYLAIGVLCVILIAMGARIASLEQEIDGLQGQLSSDYAQLRTRIDAIYANVDEQLKKQASLVTSVEHELVSYDQDHRRANVSLRVVPKTVSDDTALAVTLDGQTVSLTRQGDAFVGTLAVDPFYYGEYPLLSVTSGDATQTELLETVYLDHLFSRCLPRVSGDVKGTRTTTSVNGMLTVNGTLVLYWDAAEVGDATLTKAELVTLIDGTEVARRDLSTDMTSTIKGGITNGSLELPLQESYACTSKTPQVKILLVATDQLGYIHELPLFYHNADGLTAEAVPGMEVIRDAEGNVLYGKELS